MLCAWIWYIALALQTLLYFAIYLDMMHYPCLTNPILLCYLPGYDALPLPYKPYSTLLCTWILYIALALQTLFYFAIYLDMMYYPSLTNPILLCYLPRYDALPLPYKPYSTLLFTSIWCITIALQTLLYFVLYLDIIYCPSLTNPILLCYLPRYDVLP